MSWDRLIVQFHEFHCVLRFSRWATHLEIEISLFVLQISCFYLSNIPNETSKQYGSVETLPNRNGIKYQVKKLVYIEWCTHSFQVLNDVVIKQQKCKAMAKQKLEQNSEKAVQFEEKEKKDTFREIRTTAKEFFYLFSWIYVNLRLPTANSNWIPRHLIRCAFRLLFLIAISVLPNENIM